jgi:hypothetical protein
MLGLVMILIDTTKPFNKYLKTLSQHARKDYAYVEKHNPDLLYQCIPYKRELVEDFMRLWEQQLIRGKPIQWAFPIGHLDELAAKEELLVFQAIGSFDSSGFPKAMHFIQKRLGYWECHPPMYDKKYSQRYLAKFMWFNLIKYASEHNLGPLDMGGGLDTWREMIQRREEFPNPKYKWIYVPESVKNNPDLEPDYYIENHALRIRKTD